MLREACYECDPMEIRRIMQAGISADSHCDNDQAFRAAPLHWATFIRGTAHSSKERRRPLFWQPFSAVTEPAPGLLVPLSGILASRRRKPRKNEKKRGKNGRDMA